MKKLLLAVLLVTSTSGRVDGLIDLGGLNITK